jgi:nucleoside-diphosphate-sugar epimerase
VPDVEYVQADVLEPGSLARAVAGVDVVIHAAGLAHMFGRSQAASAPFDAVNRIGTENTVRLAAEAGARRIVLVSSVSVYGESGRRECAENAPCCPEGAYAQSKWQAEQCAREIASSYQMDLAVLRLATLYGEGDPGNVGRLMRAIDRRRFVWVGDGSNRKSLLHRDDAARACVVAAASGMGGVHVFNVASTWHTMREVVETLAAKLGRGLFPIRVPASLAMAAAEAADRLGGSRRRPDLAKAVAKWLADDTYDGRLFQTSFNFLPSVALTDGLEREVAWYRQNQLR